jgi:hypothetical protein
MIERGVVIDTRPNISRTENLQNAKNGAGGIDQSKMSWVDFDFAN